MYTNITVGADPEVFVVDENGRNMSVIGKLGGSKAKPVKTPIFGNDDVWSGYLEDNLTAEFNTFPAKNKEQFRQSITGMLSVLSSKLSTLRGSMNFFPVAKFPSKIVMAPEAQVFGCEPDYNAWTGEVNPTIVLDEDNYTLRFAGGHVHVGYDHPSDESRLRLVKALDVSLGVPSIIFSNHSSEVSRRKFYGRAGAFRPKPFGVEYRVLSNFWISDSTYIDWVYNQVVRTTEWLNGGNKIDENDMENIQNAINTMNKATAKDIIRKYPDLVLS